MSQYLDILKNAISNPHNLFILILGISFAFLLLFDLITTKKFPFIGSILFLIIISFSAIYAFKPTLIPSVIIDFLTKRYQTVKMAVTVWMGYFLVIAGVCYVVKVLGIKRRNAQFVKRLSYLPVELLWVVNRKGRMTFEKKSTETLALSNRKVKKITVNDEEIARHKLFKHLNNLEDVTNIEIKVFNKNNEVREIDLIKRNIYDKHNYYNGYILYLNKEQESQPTSVTVYEIIHPIKIDIINSFDEPIAYVDLVKKTIYLNDQMQELLETKDNVISEDEFVKYIVFEDIKFYQQDQPFKNIFRINVKKQIIWFEGTKDPDHREMIIRRTSVINYRNKLKVKNHNDLENDIRKLLHENKEFGLITISFVNIIEKAKIPNHDANALVNSIMSQYFKNLLEGYLRDSVTVYQLGNIEFGLLVNNPTTFDILTKEIVEGVEHFRKTVYTINNITIEVDLALGVVSSKGVENLPAEDIITASYEVLLQATDPNYPNNYSIYYPQTKTVKEYRLEDFDIDLSESFLEKFKLDDE